MPELPEVEVTRRGLAPRLEGRRITALEIRERRLRWPVPRSVRDLVGTTVVAVERRAKYLLIRTDSAATAIIHLGMSGSLRYASPGETPGPHDHYDLCAEGGILLRYRDPRRFGAFLCTRRSPLQHRLLRHLGPEPLGPDFSGDHLFDRSRGRRTPLRNFLLDGRVVVGVGNIYASEAAHQAGIHPVRAAGRISRARYARLAEVVRSVLRAAIADGGTTLRDFHGADGESGGHQTQLEVYGREGETCRRCGGQIQRRVSAARSLYYCGGCQT